MNYYRTSVKVYHTHACTEIAYTRRRHMFKHLLAKNWEGDSPFVRDNIRNWCSVPKTVSNVFNSRILEFYHRNLETPGSLINVFIGLSGRVCLVVLRATTSGRRRRWRRRSYLFAAAAAVAAVTGDGGRTIFMRIP